MEPKCSDCPLDKIRVPGEGAHLVDGTWVISTPNEQYDIVFVGIAPAVEELRVGRPFVGPSGGLLRQLANQMGFTNYWVANTVLCAMPEVEPIAIDACRERLLEEIKSKNPKLVVALGNVPLETLTGISYKVTSVAGRVLPSEVGPLLPVEHPSSVLRGSTHYRDFLDNLTSAVRFLDNTYHYAVEPTITTVTSGNLGECLQMLDNSDLLAVDLETTGFYPYGWNPDEIICIAISPTQRTSYIFKPEHLERLKPILESKKLIFQNGNFDCGFLWQKDVYAKIYFDTLLAHYTMDEREEGVHGLKRMAQKYLGAPDWSGDIVKDLLQYFKDGNKSLDPIPPELLSKCYKYAGFDSAYTYQLHDVFKDEVIPSLFWDIMMPCTNMFTELRHQGIQINPNLLMDMDSLLEKEYAEEEADLAKNAEYPLNPLSPLEVSDFLFNKMGIPPHPLYSTSTHRRALEALLPNPIVEGVISCRQLHKLKSSYVDNFSVFVDKTFRIHSLTKLFGSVTGRLSTEDPSMMNVTGRRGLKRIVVPVQGKLIGSGDFKQMELRCYVVIFPDEHLKEILLDPNRDPHREVGIVAFGPELADAKRGPSKAGVFGRLYKRGRKSIMYANRLTEEQTDRVIEAIDSLFPGVKRYGPWIEKQIHENGQLESYFSRLRRFGLLTRDNIQEIYRQGMNFPIQSMASDINLLCMLDLYQHSEELGVYPLFPIHDNIVMELAEPGCAITAKERMEKVAEELVHGEMKFKVEFKSGPTWGDLG